MNTNFINLTTENLPAEHLCCIIRSKKPHPGVEAKRQWLSDRLKEGHVFRKLNEKAVVFIEYAPLETAWVPITGYNYYYIYCLWVTGAHKGNGYGRSLMEYCIADAKAKGKSGICMLGSKNKKPGFPTRHLPKSSALKLSTPQTPATTFLPSPSTEPPLNLPKAPKPKQSRTKSSPSTTTINAPTPTKP